MQVKSEENGIHIEQGWQQQQQLKDQYYSTKNEGEAREAKRVCTGLEPGNGNHVGNGVDGPVKTEQRIYHNEGQRVQPPPAEGEVKCPRCESTDTKFCYYNNYSLLQPRYYCRACRRYWTKGGNLRNVPVGGGGRKTRQGSSANRRQAAPNADSPSLTSSSQVSTSPLVMSPMSPPASPVISNQPASIPPFVAAQQTTGHIPPQSSTMLHQRVATMTASSVIHPAMQTPSSVSTTQIPLSISQSSLLAAIPHTQHSYAASSQPLHVQQSAHSSTVVSPASSLSSAPNTNIYTFNIQVQVPVKDPSQLTSFPYLLGHQNPYVSFGGPMNHPVGNTGVYIAGDHDNHDYLGVNPADEQLIGNSDYIQGDSDLDSYPDANEGQEEGFKGFSLSFDQRYKLREASPESNTKTTDQILHHETDQGPQQHHPVQNMEQSNYQMSTTELKSDSNQMESSVMSSANAIISPASKVEEE